MESRWGSWHFREVTVLLKWDQLRPWFAWAKTCQDSVWGNGGNTEVKMRQTYISDTYIQYWIMSWYSWSASDAWIMPTITLRYLLLFACRLLSHDPVWCDILRVYVPWYSLCPLCNKIHTLSESSVLSYWLHRVLWGRVKMVIISYAEAWGPLNKIQPSATLFSARGQHRGPANIDPQNICTSANSARVSTWNTSTQIYNAVCFFNVP